MRHRYRVERERDCELRNFKKNQNIIICLRKGTLPEFTWLDRRKSQNKTQSGYGACFPAETHAEVNARTLTNMLIIIAQGFAFKRINFSHI